MSDQMLPERSATSLPAPVAAGRATPGLELPPESREEQNAQGLLALVNERLSGRWHLAIGLGLVLAVLGGYYGYQLTGVQYESTGIIRVSPKVTPTMHETAETGMLPQYASYLQNQASLIRTQRVLERALDSFEPGEAPWSDRREALLAIQRNLNVDAQRNDQLIRVRYGSGSPHLAQKVVNAVIRAYDELHGSAEAEEASRRLQDLRSMRDAYAQQRRHKQNQIRELLAGSDEQTLRVLMQEKSKSIHEREAEIRDLEHFLSFASPHLERLADGASEQQPTAAAPGQIEVDSRDLELFDAELAMLGKLRTEARIEYRAARSRWHEETHPGVRRARRDLDLIEQQYQDREAAVLRSYLGSEHGPLATLSSDPRVRLDRLRNEVAEQRVDIERIAATLSSVRELQSDLEDVEQGLRDTVARISGLETESDSIRRQRITVASYGDQPLSPSSDRRHALAAVGAVGGLMAGIGFFFMLACVDRRVYGLQQLGTKPGEARCLGVLPALPRNPRDIESSGVAAHCVHQIRNHIEAVRRPGPTPVIVLSSPYQGDGKTSLTMALGASYAAAGSRTLLIDCDFVGRALTHHLNLEDASGLAECIGRGRSGGGSEIEPSLHELPAAELWALPTGHTPGFGPEMLRRADLEALFQRLRRNFDVILVDTGPLFGSVESLPVASASDGVVLTMWRGRRQSRLEECKESLQRVGATCLGVVLNYAHSSDCNRYVSKSSTSALIEPVVSNGHGHENGVRRVERPTSRNALLRAMQITSRSGGVRRFTAEHAESAEKATTRAE